jgi:rod shape-determining protein MreD
VRALRAPALMLLFLILQFTLLDGVEVAGFRPDLMLLVPIVVGLAVGSEAGAVSGFAAGLTVDLFLQTPLGLSALSYCLVGFAVGTLQTSVLRAAWWIAPAIAAAGSVVGVLLFAMVAATVGEAGTFRPAIVGAAVVVAAVNGLLAPPALRAWRWAMARPADRGFVR